MVLKYYDLHVHTFLSDGELGPGEIARRAEELGVSGIAICDHVDQVTLEPTIGSLSDGIDDLNRNRDIDVKVGCELTHITPESVESTARRARRLGAQFVVVHGESPVEPVTAGTNRAAAGCEAVDLLAHPGFIDPEVVELAGKNGVALEITSRSGHNWANGRLVQVARDNPARLVLSTDAHGPGDLLGPERAADVLRGAGCRNPREVLEYNKKLFHQEAV